VLHFQQLPNLPSIHASFSFPCRFVTFRTTNLPQARSGPITVTFDLAPTSACPTLGDFCYGYDYIGGCQYMIANQQQSCCPTAITSMNY
jgi:hypothetical protein